MYIVYNIVLNYYFIQYNICIVDCNLFEHDNNRYKKESSSNFM